MTTEDDYDYDPHEDDEEEDDMNVLAGSMGSLSVGNRTPRRSMMSPTTSRGNSPRGGGGGGGEVGNSLRGAGGNSFRGAGGVAP